jgi:hypothetical protein
MAQKALANTTGTKYEFGIQVPKEINSAINLDMKNSNNLWEEANKTELKQITDYQTFIVIVSGDTILVIQILGSSPFYFLLCLKYLSVLNNECGKNKIKFLPELIPNQCRVSISVVSTLASFNYAEHNLTTAGSYVNCINSV